MKLNISTKRQLTVDELKWLANNKNKFRLNAQRALTSVEKFRKVGKPFYILACPDDFSINVGVD